MDLLKDKGAVVTGAASGIGKAIATAFIPPEFAGINLSYFKATGEEVVVFSLRRVELQRLAQPVAPVPTTLKDRLRQERDL